MPILLKLLPKNAVEEILPISEATITLIPKPMKPSQEKKVTDQDN